MSTKDTNPKDAVGIKKAPLSTVSLPFVAAVGVAMLEGALKYGRHNYRVAGVRLSVYVDAIFRHLAAMWEGEWLDPDCGMPHIIKIAACCAVVFDAHIRGKLVDDRPPKTQDGWLKEMNDNAGKLIEKYPKPIPAYLNTDQKEVSDGK